MYVLHSFLFGFFYFFSIFIKLDLSSETVLHYCRGRFSEGYDEVLGKLKFFFHRNRKI